MKSFEATLHANAMTECQEGRSSSSMNNTEYESKSHWLRLGKDLLQAGSILYIHRVRYLDMERDLMF